MSDHDSDLKGRTAKAHIDKWQQYGEKAPQHATAAAIILSEVKEKLPHGQYTPWLKQFGIEPRTARRLVLEFKEPNKAVERREAQSRRNAEVWSKSATSDRFENPSIGDDVNAPHVSTDAQRAWLLDYIRQACPGEVAQLFDLLGAPSRMAA